MDFIEDDQMRLREMMAKRREELEAGIDHICAPQDNIADEDIVADSSVEPKPNTNAVESALFECLRKSHALKREYKNAKMLLESEIDRLESQLHSNNDIAAPEYGVKNNTIYRPWISNGQDEPMAMPSAPFLETFSCGPLESLGADDLLS